MEKEIVFVVAFHCLYVFNVTIADRFVRIGKVKKILLYLQCCCGLCAKRSPLESSDA